MTLTLLSWGGLAGLSTARKLVAAGNTAVVLEARNRVAGRNMDGFLSNGVPVEMGGKWVGPTQDVVLGLIQELGLETFRNFDQGEALIEYDGNIVRHSDRSFGLPPESALEVGRLWDKLEALTHSLSPTPKTASLDSSSASSFRRCSPPSLRNFRSCIFFSTSNPAPAWIRG